MKELTVTYQGLGEARVVGTLADDGRHTLFQYAPEAVARGLQLSPIRLPLRTRAYPDKPADFASLHSVPGLIYDSLPDGWGYRLMHRRIKAVGMNPDTLSTLDMLAYLGANTMGALTYAPAPSQDSQNWQALNLLGLAQEIQSVLTDDRHDVLAELARAGGSPGGARPKALVHFNPQSGQMSTQASQVPGGQAWLVKFAGSDDALDSCAVEAWYAQMAHECQLGMSATQLFELPGGKSCFGTQRFDRRGEQRVHVHTLAGLLHANFQVPSVGYKDFFRVTRKLTRDQRELQKAVQRCAFNILMNNRDDHAKNISFLMEADGRWQLAPPYDLSYCPGYQGQHFMDVAGEATAPNRQHVLQAAAAAGLSATLAGQAIDHVLQHATPQRLLALADSLPLKKKTVQTVHTAMKTHWEALAG